MYFFLIILNLKKDLVNSSVGFKNLPYLAQKTEGQA